MSRALPCPYGWEVTDASERPPPGNELHGGRLHALTRTTGSGTFYAPCDVIFSFHDVVVPDLLVIAADQLQVLTEANVRGAPALVVEIQSPGTRRRDETIKRRLFDRGGVREYWLVDPAKNRIRIYRRDADGTFPLVLDLSRETGGVLTTPLLPGFSVEVATVLAE